jgi:spore maturation protein CgeB
LINLNSEILLSAPMWDYLATFNKATLPVLHKLGFPKVVWLPFAADMSAHYMPFKEGTKQNDVAFVGGWRPEREHALLAIAKNFPELKIKIYGPFWNKCQDQSLRKVTTPQPLFGKRFSEVVQDSMINLNVIDAAGYPAANMRFYEIPIAGGFELCSSVPELEDTFKDGQDLFFFKNTKELIEKVDAAIKDPERIQQMGKRMQERIYRDHNYESRANDLIKQITA